jgi:hypothetical protein
MKDLVGDHKPSTQRDKALDLHATLKSAGLSKHYQDVYMVIDYWSELTDWFEATGPFEFVGKAVYKSLRGKLLKTKLLIGSDETKCIERLESVAQTIALITQD